MRYTSKDLSKSCPPKLTVLAVDRLVNFQMEFSHLSSAGGVQLIPKNSAEPWRWKVGWNGIAQLKGAVLGGPTVEEWRV
ncbi:hypothetical protein AB1N83_002205 [Pleurotus pulmonarius]